MCARANTDHAHTFFFLQVGHHQGGGGGRFLTNTHTHMRVLGGTAHPVDEELHLPSCEEIMATAALQPPRPPVQEAGSRHRQACATAHHHADHATPKPSPRRRSSTFDAASCPQHHAHTHTHTQATIFATPPSVHHQSRQHAVTLPTPPPPPPTVYTCMSATTAARQPPTASFATPSSPSNSTRHTREVEPPPGHHPPSAYPHHGHKISMLQLSQATSAPTGTTHRHRCTPPASPSRWPSEVTRLKVHCRRHQIPCRLLITITPQKAVPSTTAAQNCPPCLAVERPSALAC